MIPFQVDQYLEEAALLFTRRTWYVEQPHVGWENLLELDRRIDAQLDGLVEAGAAAWIRCLEELESPQPGECFAAAFLALQHGDSTRLDRVLDAAEGDDRLVQPVAMALGWRPWDEIAKLARGWLRAGSWQRAVGLSAHLVHGVDPGEGLAAALDDSNATVRQLALQGVGELGRADLTDRVIQHLSDSAADCACWAHWSTGLLRSAACDLRRLTSIVMQRPELAGWFWPLIVAHQDSSIRQTWQDELLQPGTQRLWIALAAREGNCEHIPRLLDFMRDPETARVAGEAFTVLAGLRIQGATLETPPPPDLETGPSDDPEEDDVAIDSDEYLPWPNVAAVTDWWQANQASFSTDQRYFLGHPLTEAWLWQVLRIGKQRERFQAALNLALSPIGRKLFDVRAPSVLQYSRLPAIDSG